MPLNLSLELLKQPSISPNDNGCLEIIKEHLNPLGFKCVDYNFNQTSNLYATYGDKGPLFVFAGHTDVVPVGNEADWKFNPFEPTIENDILYGRGAVDMKCAIAAMISATSEFLEELKSDNKTLNGRIAFLLTSDEEGDNTDGTKRVIENLKRQNIVFDYCLIGEPTSETNIGDIIKIGRRGSLHAKLEIIGTQGHIAYPSKIKNPIHFALKPLQNLLNEKWDNGNEHFEPTNMQISNLHAGTGAKNVVPNSITADINFRYSPEITQKQIIDRAKKLIEDGLRQDNGLIHTYNISWSLSGEPYYLGADNLAKIATDAISKVSNVKAKYSTIGGISDGRFIKAIANEIIEIGLKNDLAHKIDESTNVKDILQLKDIYKEILKNVF